MTENTNAPAPTPSQTRRREMIVLLLSAVGAGLDAVMLMAFGVLTAAQTGNTILLSVAIGQAQWATGLAAGISLVGYCIGSGVGELIVESRQGRDEPPPIAGALASELLLLASVLVGWRMLGREPGPRGQDVLVALAALAMGIQSAVTLRLHTGPASTYVTGELTTFVTGAIRWWRGQHARAKQRGPSGSGPGERPWIFGLAWGAYIAGAIATALLYLASHEAALLLPLVVLGVVVLAACVQQRSDRR